MDILADPLARRPAFGPENPFDLPFRVAAKTGTARGFADTVAVAATRELTVAVWAGTTDGTATHGIPAMTAAAPLARAALLTYADGRALTLPPRPAAIVPIEVCEDTGTAPTTTCGIKRDWGQVPGS
jgi:membrane carboxypeptidase/penicillin-binding protein PbpC